MSYDQLRKESSFSVTFTFVIGVWSHTNFMFYSSVLCSGHMLKVDQVTFALSVVGALVVTNATMAFTRNPVHKIEVMAPQPLAIDTSFGSGKGLTWMSSSS